MKQILLIDENLPFTRLFALFLRQHLDYNVSVASDGNEGAGQHRRNPADLVITQFPVPKNPDFFSDLKEVNPEVKVITLSFQQSTNGQDNLSLARQLGVRRPFLKPLVVEEVLEAIEEELETLIPNN